MIHRLTFLFFLFTTALFSQSLEGEPIFVKHQKNIQFLNAKTVEIDSILSLYTDLFKNYKNSPEDNKKLVQYSRAFEQSNLSFTFFNTSRILDIDTHLTTNKPIKGSEIAYLHHSFKVYKKYIAGNNLIINKTKRLLKKQKNEYLTNILLMARLNKMSLFYKNYYNSIKNKRIRRVLNESDATYDINDNDLRKIVLKELNLKNFLQVKKAIKKSEKFNSNFIFIDSSFIKRIRKSSYTKSRMWHDDRKMRTHFDKDNVYQSINYFTHHLSRIVGNTAGAIRIRKGYLYKNDSIRNEIFNQLEPMDILAEKTGFALTDKMIPGYFGHIAIWLGTEEQLKKIDMWNHPTIVPFQEKISQGYSIIESARDGTHLKKMKDFINVDELAIARIKSFTSLDKDEKVTLFQSALSQLGKEYDFNFDVETSSKLVCSELLYQVFGSIYWPTDNFLQRTTISPDNVLSLSLYQNSPIELTYYIEGINKKSFVSKSLDDLAQDLGYIKKEEEFLLQEIKCKKVSKKGKWFRKKECKTIFHKLIYEE